MRFFNWLKRKKYTSETPTYFSIVEDTILDESWSLFLGDGADVTRIEEIEEDALSPGDKLAIGFNAEYSSDNPKYWSKIDEKLEELSEDWGVTLKKGKTSVKFTQGGALEFKVVAEVVSG